MNKIFPSLLASLAGFSGTALAQVNTSDLRAYSGSLYIGAEALRQASAFSEAQLLRGSGFSAGVGLANYEVDEDEGRRFEGDVKTYTGSLAYVHAFEALNVGIAVSFVDGELDADGTDTNPNVTMDTKGDGWLVTLGASKSWEKLSLVLKGTAGELDFDSDREDGNFNPKQSDYDSTLYQIELTALYSLYTTENYALEPFARLGYASIENDGFTESNSPDANTIDDLEDDRPYGEIGLRGELFTLGDFVPHASIAVWQDLGDNELDFDGVDAATNSFSFETPDAVDTAVKANLGFSWALSDGMNLGASVGYFIGDELDGVNADLALNWSF
jgi:outer membrane autotransporter protein